MVRNRIIYGILFIGSTLLVYYEPNLITSIFFHTVLYLMILSSAHLIYSYIKVKVGQNLNPVVVEHGQETDYFCTIYNEGSVPTSIITVNFLFHSSMFKGQLFPKTFTLAKKKNRPFRFHLSCRYRGVYAVGIDYLEIYDILNIFKLRIRNIEAKNVTVLPKVTQLLNFNLSPKAESDIKSTSNIRSIDANSLVDVRAYEPGDAIKRIHWKLSARHNEVLVRNLERSAQNSTLVFLDTSKGNYSFEKNIIVEDKLMEALVSIVNHRLKRNNPVEFIYYNYEAKNIKYSQKEDFHDFFSSAAQLSFWHSKSVKSIIDDYFIEQYYNQNLHGKDVFVFTCHPEQLENQAIIHKLLGNQCTVHIVSSSYDDNREGAYRSSEGIFYYDLTPSSSLQDIFVRSV